MMCPVAGPQQGNNQRGDVGGWGQACSGKLGHGESEVPVKRVAVRVWHFLLLIWEEEKVRS